MNAPDRRRPSRAAHRHSTLTPFSLGDPRSPEPTLTRPTDGGRRRALRLYEPDSQPRLTRLTRLTLYVSERAAGRAPCCSSGTCQNREPRISRRQNVRRGPLLASHVILLSLRCRNQRRKGAAPSFRAHRAYLTVTTGLHLDAGTDSRIPRTTRHRPRIVCAMRLDDHGIAAKSLRRTGSPSPRGAWLRHGAGAAETGARQAARAAAA